MDDTDLMISSVENEHDATTGNHKMQIYNNIAECKELVICLQRYDPKNTAILENTKNGLTKTSSRGRHITIRKQLEYKSGDVTDDDVSTDDDITDSDEDYVHDYVPDDINSDMSDSEYESGDVAYDDVTNNDITDSDEDHVSDINDMSDCDGPENKSDMGKLITYQPSSENKTGKKCDVAKLSKTPKCLPENRSTTFVFTNVALICGNEKPLLKSEEVHGNPRYTFTEPTKFTPSAPTFHPDLCIKKDGETMHTQQDDKKINESIVNYSSRDRDVDTIIKGCPNWENMSMSMSQIFDDIIKAEMLDKSMIPEFDLKDFPGASELMSIIANEDLTDNMNKWPPTSEYSENSVKIPEKISNTVQIGTSSTEVAQKKSNKHSICLLCGAREGRGLYISHMTKHFITGLIPHGCGICLEVFGNGSCLEKHMHSVHNLQPIKKSPACDHCARKFVGKCKGEYKSYQIHRISDAKKTENFAQRFRFESKYATFERQVNVLNESRDCNFCGCSIKDFDQMLTHIISSHPTEVDSSLCNFCGRDFNGTEYKYKWIYEIHEYNHKFIEKNTDMAYVKCPVCKLDCRSFYEWSCHLLFHQSPLGVDCHICGHNLRTAAYLRNHLATHPGIREYKCQVCDKTFANHGSLIRHTGEHSQVSQSDQYIICLLCELKVHERLFVSHMATHFHYERMPHCCAICFDIFENGSSLENHMRCIHNLQAIKKSPACDCCAKKFLGKCAGKDKSYQIHRVTDPEKMQQVISSAQLQNMKHEKHSKIFTQTCKCSFCHCSLEEWDQLLTHVSSAHANEVNSSLCNFCGRNLHGPEYKHNWIYEIQEYNYKFEEKITDTAYFKCTVCKLDCSSFYEWSCHLLFHQSPFGVDCHVCARNSQSVTNLRSHLAKHTKEAKFPCLMCHKRFVSQRRLKGHRLRMHPLKKCDASVSNQVGVKKIKRRHYYSEFLCHVCGKFFHTKYYNLAKHMATHFKASCYICGKSISPLQLKKHLRVHKKSDKNKKCSKCHRSFTTDKKLDEHYDAIHLKKNFSCVCEYCGAGFTNRMSMSFHINKHHTKKKKYKCDLCDKDYFTTISLKLHIRTHTGERPFCCTHCPKAFASSYNLTDHIRIHTGEKPYKCPVCDKAFTKSCNMKKHVKLMHSSKTTKSD